MGQTNCAHICICKIVKLNSVAIRLSFHPIWNIGIKWTSVKKCRRRRKWLVIFSRRLHPRRHTTTSCPGIAKCFRIEWAQSTQAKPPGSSLPGGGGIPQSSAKPASVSEGQRGQSVLELVNDDYTDEQKSTSSVLSPGVPNKSIAINR